MSEVDFFGPAFPPIKNDLDEKARRWVTANNETFEVLFDIAEMLIKSKLKFSAKMLVELLRCNAQFTGGEPVRMSNNYTAYLGRLMCAVKPELAEHFVLSSGASYAELEEWL